jgi:amino acid adenylation domain-containing protein
MSNDWFDAIAGSDMFSLSPAQHGLWVASALAQHSSAYHSTRAWKIVGNLNIDALEGALDYTVNSHPALRTQFVDTASGPRQTIVAAEGVVLRQGKASQEVDEGAFISQALAAEASLPFDLGRDLPIRAQILSLQEDKYLFLISVHHLVFDGTAIGLILRDLTYAYDSFVAGRSLAVDSELDRWNEYLAKMMTLGLDSATCENSAYWRSKLRGLPSLINLPLDRARTEQLVGRGAWEQVVIDETTAASLSRLVRSTNSSFFTVVTGVIMSLIYRYTGDPDVCIGYPVSNRFEKGYETWVGCMVNTLPLRVAFPAKCPFDSLVQVLRALIIEGKRHASYLIDEIISEFRDDFRDGRSPLSQVIVNQNLNYEPALSLADLEIHPLPRRTDEAPFELAWIIVGKTPSLRIRLEYNADLFDRSTIERMVGHFKTLLEEVVANPQSRVQDLPLLTEAERHQILVEWNDTKTDFPQDKCIHQLFEEQVERSPDAVAVVFEDQQLTYAQLNAKANQLAHHLRSLGVKPDTLVAICVERSLEMVIGLLGILKAGGAYVPLDPDYPEERLAFMLQDTAAAVLVTQAHIRERVPQTEARAVCIDSDWCEIGNCADSNPTTVASALNLAYCIYTSGSTGRPKGALNTHRGFVNLLMWYAGDRAGHSSPERTLLASSLSFDLTQKNIIGPLTSGGMLIVPNGPTADVDAIAAGVACHKPTRVNCAPSAFRACREAILCESLNTVILGGEPIDAALVADCDAKGLTLVNSYGPTECADVAISHVRDHSAQTNKCPLGHPLPNVQVYLLDAQLQAVPVGVTGELHIAGVGVGRGYLNRPDLTAEKFVPDPFGEPGSRMYKTGDLARYLPDGNIEFLGRIDHQVKIRGFRIELGEVEAALQRCQRVREAVVLAREDEPGDKRLVAYVVPTSGTLAVEELRTQLSGCLPEYMVPSAWVVLDHLPLNPNGKIDRDALPTPQPYLQGQTSLPHVLSSSDPILNGVLAILRELMPTVILSSKDDLFANGLHSVLLLRFVAACRAQFGVRLGLRDVYRNGTAEGIAEMIGLASRSTNGASAV